MQAVPRACWHHAVQSQARAWTWTRPWTLPRPTHAGYTRLTYLLTYFRFYEALVAKCVPLLLADRFEPAFTTLAPLEGYAVRASEDSSKHAKDSVDSLPAVAARALERWPKLFAGVQAVRPAFVYSLGFEAGRRAGGPPPCDAARAILAEVGARFADRAAVGHL